MGVQEEDKKTRGRKAPERDRLQLPVPSPLSAPLDAQSHFAALRSCFNLANCVKMVCCMFLMNLFTLNVF